MWILWKMIFWKCEFCEKWGFEIVNFCVKRDFEIVNFVKNEISKMCFVKNETLKMWILWKMRLWNCEFCEKWDFQNVNFWINWGFLPHCADRSEFSVWWRDSLTMTITMKSSKWKFLQKKNYLWFPWQWPLKKKNLSGHYVCTLYLLSYISEKIYRASQRITKPEKPIM